MSRFNFSNSSVYERNRYCLEKLANAYADFFDQYVSIAPDSVMAIKAATMTVKLPESQADAPKTITVGDCKKKHIDVIREHGFTHGTREVVQLCLKAAPNIIDPELFQIPQSNIDRGQQNSFADVVPVLDEYIALLQELSRKQMTEQQATIFLAIKRYLSEVMQSDLLVDDVVRVVRQLKQICLSLEPAFVQVSHAGVDDAAAFKLHAYASAVLLQHVPVIQQLESNEFTGDVNKAQALLKRLFEVLVQDGGSLKIDDLRKQVADFAKTLPGSVNQQNYSLGRSVLRKPALAYRVGIDINYLKNVVATWPQAIEDHKQLFAAFDSIKQRIEFIESPDDNVTNVQQWVAMVESGKLLNDGDLLFVINNKGWDEAALAADRAKRATYLESALSIGSAATSSVSSLLSSVGAFTASAWQVVPSVFGSQQNDDATINQGVGQVDKVDDEQQIVLQNSGSPLK